MVVPYARQSINAPAGWFRLVRVSSSTVCVQVQGSVDPYVRDNEKLSSSNPPYMRSFTDAWENKCLKLFNLQDKPVNAASWSSVKHSSLASSWGDTVRLWFTNLHITLVFPDWVTM